MSHQTCIGPKISLPCTQHPARTFPVALLSPGRVLRSRQNNRVPAIPLKEPAAAGSTSLREGLSCITGKRYASRCIRLCGSHLRGWAFALLPHASHNTLCSRNRVIRGPSRKRDPPLRDFRTKWRYARAGLERAVTKNANDPGPRIFCANPPRHAARQPLWTPLGYRKIAAAGSGSGALVPRAGHARYARPVLFVLL